MAGKKRARRYRLPLYQRALKRWISATFWMAVFLAAFAVAAWFFAPQISTTKIYILAGAAVAAGLVTLLFFAIRKSSYVCCMQKYLLIATPFLRVKVPYRRIKRTFNSEMSALFPAKKLSTSRRDILGPLAGHTALILVLDSYPRSPGLMRAFMSPFFFYEKSPHFVLLVDDWMSLSVELESIRSAAKQQPLPPPASGGPMMPASRKQAPAKPKKSGSGLLSNLD
jgi:hypothetical protein